MNSVKVTVGMEPEQLKNFSRYELMQMVMDAEKYGKDADNELARVRSELTAMRADLTTSNSRRDAALDACRALMLMIGNGTLVRDISKDSEACSAVRRVSLVRTLLLAQDVIDAAEEKSKAL